MARKVIVELVDDYDGRSIAEETVVFALDGVDYEIDLSKPNAAQLRAEFAQWAEHARKAGRSSKAKAKPAGATRSSMDREQTHAIREWARKNGFEISNRGRVPTKIVDAYNAR